MVSVNGMPSVHIPENQFRELVDREGGYAEAKAAVKTAVDDYLDQNNG